LGSLPGVCGGEQGTTGLFAIYVNWAKDFANFLPEKPFPEQ
jgi:hypothetical protein